MTAVSRTGKAVGVATAAGLAGWFFTTLIAQHPERSFDIIRRYDPVALFIPNWRFFAPDPAQHDFHIMHRVLTDQGEQTEWSPTCMPADRALVQAVWFPSRRQDKALFDVCSNLVGQMARHGNDVLESIPYQLLRNFTARQVRAEYRDRPTPQGFQFLVARYTGYDETGDPESVFVSPFIRIGPGGAQRDGEGALHGAGR